jgi:DNA transformation protein
MDADTEFIRYLRDQFRRWGPIEMKRMFGSYGIFRTGVLFALIRADTLYLRSDETSAGEFEAAGMEPFRYNRNGETVALNYHQAPPDSLEDPDVLAQWADRAYAIAMRNHAAKVRKAKNRTSKTKRGRSNRS